MWNRIRTLIELRQIAIHLENEQTLRLPMSRNLRAGSGTACHHGQKVQIWLPEKKIWKGNYRFIYDSGRNSYLELGASLIKVPTRWVRPAIELEKLNSLEIDKGRLAPKGIDEDGSSPQIHSEIPRSSDGTVEPKAPPISRLHAFVTWGKYNLLSHMLYGMLWIWKTY